MKLQELFNSEDKWTKHEVARDKYKHPVSITDANATCYCLMGGMEICYPNADEWVQVKNKIQDKVDTFVTSWNDAPERTFSDIRKLIEELDI